ncbi:MAG: TIGR00375 family protein [Methanospirillum sp.]|uniref:TIGR00375 family protein n=1 Tax=Methanospirillum sp. TaxID=45200 RepID=UPI00236F105A|nr:TIGR00375 family protein [Methanospirillum sp.]MDD1728007.1 TIGR00375 family protein [Methanospirillum sp.]
MLLTIDLHIHSCFSMASSPRMLPDPMLNGCRLKGISVIGTGDILHPVWREMWEKTTVPDDMIVVPTTEVEGADRVHHLILFPDFGVAQDIADELSQFSKNISKNGRPQVRLPGEAIAQRVHELGGMIGPAHAFTPWTSLYAAHNSVSSCYGNEPIDFLELGLSADSGYGNRIADLASVPFLTNSDAHSPEPAKLGREFTRIETRTGSPGTSDILDAIREGRIVMNAGFFPEEGKYNRTACTRCFTPYSLAEAENFKWKCPADKGRIKKGVRERAEELSSGTTTVRPPYLHIIPLAEIIQRTLGTCSATTKRCSELYQQCLARFGNEISILTETPPDDLREFHQELGDAIAAFREGRIILHPGGGGKYGSFELG